MIDKRTFILAHDEARRRAMDAVINAPDGYAVVVRESTRNLDQNAAMWPVLEAFSKQLHWPVDGRLVKLLPEEWKDILTAAFEQETVRVAQGLNGGFVMLGKRTREFGKKKFSEFLDFIHAEAAERGLQI